MNMRTQPIVATSVTSQNGNQDEAIHSANIRNTMRRVYFSLKLILSGMDSSFRLSL